MPREQMQKGDTCLVTGATGYLASWVCKYLIDDGFHVKGTMRNIKDTDRLANM
jgi:dihydroflavonol-4-reductase